ncbi:MAG: alpha-ketoacid dehydrogenase subunit beta, partial [Armatimonadetes bacterium]|nr:alpha-ketoacid dehydrogenase subunit beta [Armatimonadota bacterium]
MRELYFSHALREALEEEMERDECVVLIGEDIAEYGGAFKITADIVHRFGPERVRNTPISEAGFVGIAIGAAMTGLRPVVEIMFMDFITLAMDQLINHAAKFRYMYNGQVSVPLVVRTPAGAGRRYGPTHSQSLERHFVSTPGLLVVAPATPADAKGLLKAAIRCDDPVIFVESKILYGRRGEVPEGDYVTPLGRARVALEGTDVTIVAWSRMVEESIRAAEALNERGVQAEVIDLRTLAPLDMAAIAASVQKTGRVVVAEEGPLTGGVGAEIVSRIVAECFYDLDAPPRRVAAADVPVPASPALEDAVTPDARRIVEAVAEVLAG